MGLFKQMKDMKKTVEAAPDIVNQAQQMGAQAQEMAAAQQAAAQQAATAAQQAADQAADAGGAGYEPIAGVSLEQFAEVCKGIAAAGNDQSKGPEIAESKGISGDSWQQALDGWNARIAGDGALAQKFNRIYTGS